MPDIVLSYEQAVEAAELFIEQLRQDLADDADGNIPLSKAIELLQSSFETIKSVAHPLREP
jgi:hypothetical protein